MEPEPDAPSSKVVSQVSQALELLKLSIAELRQKARDLGIQSTNPAGGAIRSTADILEDAASQDDQRGFLVPKILAHLVGTTLVAAATDYAALVAADKATVVERHNKRHAEARLLS